jgi:hypothetical protein
MPVWNHLVEIVFMSPFPDPEFETGLSFRLKMEGEVVTVKWQIYRSIRLISS